LVRNFTPWGSQSEYLLAFEVWIICFFNDINGWYAIETHSIPELGIGGGSKGMEPQSWIYNGINPIWTSE